MYELLYSAQLTDSRYWLRFVVKVTRVFCKITFRSYNSVRSQYRRIFDYYVARKIVHAVEYLRYRFLCARLYISNIVVISYNVNQ